MVPGSSVATVLDSASTRIPDSEMAARWSADVAPISAASSAPPDARSSSAWSLSPKPADFAAVRIVLVSSIVNTPGSQNTSAKRARPSDATPGSMVETSKRTYSERPFATVAVLERNFVGAEPGGHEPHGKDLTKPADHAERLDLVVRRKPVTRLHFDGRNAARGEATQTRHGEPEQLVLVPATQVTHGRVNPAATPGDLHVVETGRPELLLLEPRLAEDGVRVRVHEPRREDASPAIDRRRAGICSLEGRASADGSDRSVDDRDGDAGHDPGVTHLTSAPRPTGSTARDDLRRVDEQQRNRGVLGAGCSK